MPCYSAWPAGNFWRSRNNPFVHTTLSTAEELQPPTHELSFMIRRWLSRYGPTGEKLVPWEWTAEQIGSVAGQINLTHLGVGGEGKDISLPSSLIGLCYNGNESPQAPVHNTKR